jgi:hypothetical protein
MTFESGLISSEKLVLKNNLAGDLGFSTGSLAQTNVCATIYEQLQTQAI